MVRSYIRNIPFHILPCLYSVHQQMSFVPDISELIYIWALFYFFLNTGTPVASIKFQNGFSGVRAS